MEPERTKRKYEHKTEFKDKIKLRDINIAKLRATGMSQSKIATNMQKDGWEVSEPTVKAVLKKDSVKEIVERERERLLNLVPQAVKNYERWVNRAHTYQDKIDKQIAFQATTKVLESPGIISGTPSSQINIMMNSNNTIISPILEKLLEKFMETFKEDSIDAEFETVNS